MSNKPGRNDPCYCGSGQKYKKCHMKIDQQAERDQRAWKEAGRFLRRDLLQFARDDRFAIAFAEALPFYWNGLYEMDNAEEMGQAEALRFIDWFFFDYDYTDEDGNGRRLVEIYHQEKRGDLSDHQQQVIDAWVNAKPSGAYTLTGYDGQLLHLKDYMTGEEFDVYEGGGRGVVEIGEVILTRLVPVNDRLEFSTDAAYLPAAEITDIGNKLSAAKETYLADHPDASHDEFMRRNNHILIHHALEQAEVQGRPPVMRLDPNRADEKTQKIVRQIQKLKR